MMKRYLLLALVLLVGCKNSSQPVSLDDKSNVVHIKYTQPINGYDVKIKWAPDTRAADLTFTKGSSSFVVEAYSFDPGITENSRNVTLQYKPKPEGEMLYSDEPFFFSDVDFDGVDELLVVDPMRESNDMYAYRVFELDGREREDDPFLEISDMTDFDASEKSITINRYRGVLVGGTRLKYRLQMDGSFALTDSTDIEYGFKGDELVDRVRTHYRKQGEKWVLVKKEIL